MNGREFLDTNVLIHAHDARDPHERACVRELMQSGYLVERLAFRNSFQALS